jgi:hypothetical protein
LEFFISFSKTSPTKSNPILLKALFWDNKWIGMDWKGEKHLSTSQQWDIKQTPTYKKVHDTQTKENLEVCFHLKSLLRVRVRVRVKYS